MRHNSGYLAQVYEPTQLVDTISRVVSWVEAHRGPLDFDAIAFRGSSGALLAPAVSAFTGLGLIHVRKPDGNHHKDPIEGVQDARRFLILDDFISSGDTIDRILYEIDRWPWWSWPKPQCAGILLYGADYIRQRTIEQFAPLPIGIITDDPVEIHDTVRTEPKQTTTPELVIRNGWGFKTLDAATYAENCRCVSVGYVPNVSIVEIR